MEKNQNEVLSEIKALLSSLKEQIEVLEDKVASLETLEEIAIEEAALEAVAESFEEELPAEEETPAEEEAPVMEETPAVEDLPVMEEAAVMEDIPAEDVPATEENPAAEETPAEENTAAEENIFDIPEDIAAEAPKSDEPIDISVDIDLDVPSFEAPAPEPETVPVAEEFPPKKTSINDAETAKVKKAVLDVTAKKQAWRTDMPGTPVKNIISAISLGDRALFVNSLFKGEPEAFQEAISKLNDMQSFDEAVAFVEENYSGWNLSSDIVYRLMMAIRRKLR